MTFSRRAFIFGATAALAAPAVVRAEALMKIAVLRSTVPATALISAKHADGVIRFATSDPDGFWEPRVDLEAPAGYVRFEYVKAGRYTKLGQPVRLEGGVAWAD